MHMAIDGKGIKGRGAAEQVPNRFLRRHYSDEHPEALDPIEEGPVPTRYVPEHAKRIINPVRSPDLPFSWSMNPYQGCEHGCSYCYARPTHEYWGYSAGLDFERVVLVKRNAPVLLEQELRHPRWKGEPISLSGVTDPYQPIERRERITRGMLEVMRAFHQPVALITKNALVLRDLDILAEMASEGTAVVAISLTTLDEGLRRVLEPRTSTAVQRLRAMETLSRAGVPVLAMVAPIIPTLNEPELPMLMKAAADAGARSAAYTVLRTNGAVAPVFEQWLRRHFPDRAGKVLAQTRSLHGGAVHDAEPGRRMKGEGAFAGNIAHLFKVLHRRHFRGVGLPALDSGHFKRPPQGQLELFQ